jgi:hypothetical protein
MMAAEGDTIMRLTRTLAALSLILGFLAAPALAGPPLICHSIDIGSRRSLPWLVTGRWNGADPTYDVARLGNDTLALLSPDTPVAVRMETLRRAAIYSARQAGVADQLTIRLIARAMNAQADGAPNPSAWFDAGYFAETLRQAATVYTYLQGSDRDAWMIRTDTQRIDGLAWIRMAVRLGDAGAQPVIAAVERARTRGR